MFHNSIIVFNTARSSNVVSFGLNTKSASGGLAVLLPFVKEEMKAEKHSEKKKVCSASSHDADPELLPKLQASIGAILCVGVYLLLHPNRTRRTESQVR